MSEHELKTWPGPFAEIRRGTKTHEVRKFDRPFAMGDTLRLREYAPANERDLPGRYTGEEMRVLVTSIAVGSWGLPPDLCVMSIRAIADATTRAPERVTDEELAEIERLDREATPGPWIDTGDAVISDAERDCDGTPYVVVEPYCRPADRAFIAAARTLLPRLAASERARRKNDAAIGRLLDEAGGTAREGETLRARVERLAKLAQGNEEAALQWREVARARTEALDTCRAATPQWARFREQFAGLLEVDYQARHLSEDAGDEGVDIRVARRDFEALQAALDFVDPDEGHDCATRASLWSLFDVCATEVADIAALLTLAGIASEDRLPLRVARAITEREAAAHQAAGLQVALTAAIDELQKGSES